MNTKCACVADDSWACFQIRYYGHVSLDSNERCECPCHSEYQDDEFVSENGGEEMKGGVKSKESYSNPQSGR